MPPVRKLPWVLLGFCLLVLYLTLFFRLGSLAYMGADEARYARVAEEMLARGQYVTPRLEDAPWLEKPPLLYWLEAASFRLWGISEGAARFPSAMLGALTALLTGGLAWTMAGFRAGLMSCLILATSALFVGWFRTASTDAPLTAALTMALACGYWAAQSRRISWMGLAGAALGLAVLAKGPVALILLGGIFAVYSAIRQEFPWSLAQTAVGALTTLLVALPWFWLVWLENGYDFLLTFWLNHHIARFISDIHHHSQPFWYYLPVLLSGFFPWVFFIGSAWRRTWSRRDELDENPVVQGEVFLWVWAAVPLIFFSASRSKLAGYILPILPALSVLAALVWDRYAGTDLRVYRHIKIELKAMRLFILFLSAAMPFAMAYFYGSLPLGILLALPLWLGLLLLALPLGKSQPAAAFLTVVAMMTLFICSAYGPAASTIEGHHSAREAVLAVRPRLSQAQPLVFYRYFHHTARYYAGYRAREESIGSLDGLIDYFRRSSQQSYPVLTKKDGWKDLEAYFDSRLIHHKGNLYLAEVRSPFSP